MRLKTTLAAALIIGFVAIGPAGAEDRAAFAKRVAKYAAIDPNKPKGLCHCHDQYDTTGYVVLDATGSTVNVTCQIPEFDYMTGEFIGQYIQCAIQWDMLGK